MVIDLLSAEAKLPVTNQSLNLEALALEQSSISQFPGWFCPPAFVQSRASLLKCLNQRPVTVMNHAVGTHHPPPDPQGPDTIRCIWEERNLICSSVHTSYS